MGRILSSRKFDWTSHPVCVCVHGYIFDWDLITVRTDANATMAQDSSYADTLGKCNMYKSSMFKLSAVNPVSMYIYLFYLPIRNVPFIANATLDLVESQGLHGPVRPSVFSGLATRRSAPCQRWRKDGCATIIVYLQF